MISCRSQAGSATSTYDRYCNAQNLTPRGGVVSTAVKVCSSRSKICMSVPKRSSTSSSTAVAVQHHPLRRAYKGVNGILRLLLLRRRFAAGLVQYPNIRHAVNAVQPRVRIVVGDADKVIVFVGVHHLIGAESVGRRRMLPFVISVVQVIQGHFLLACNGLVQLLNIPKNLPVTGLMSLPGDGQMAILFPLVDTVFGQAAQSALPG